MQATAEWLDTDYYDLLGVPATASVKEIRTAYRKLARELHPDRNPDDPGAEARFSEIAKAYEVLSDDTSRADYDDLRARGPQASFGSDFVDLGDLFGDLFARHHAAPRRGPDMSARLEVDFVDAVDGMTTVLTVGGSEMTVRIPAGVSDGQTIRLRGKGYPGGNGGTPGDLFIDVSVRPHPKFGRSGHDLTTTTTVSYEEAALGCTIDIETLHGHAVKARVPAGTSPGTRLRIAGHGVATKSKKGDLLVTVNVTVPSSLTDEERTLLEQIRELRRARAL